MRGAFGCWCVYENPEDFPGKFVARMWSNLVPTGSVVVCEDIQTLRQRMIRMGLSRVLRDKDDDPVIVEVWI